MRHTQLIPLAGRAAAALALVGVLAPPCPADDSPPKPVKDPILHLLDGGFALGTFATGAEPGKALRWRADGFASPFDFKPAAVDSIHFPAPAAPPKAEGEFRFELTGGDILFGSLLDLNDKEALVEVAHAGKLRIPRARLERIEPWKSRHTLVYEGPGRLADWTVVKNGNGAARDEANQIVLEQGNVTVYRDVKLPPRSLVEFTLSWKTKPTFALTLGVEKVEGAGKAVRGYRIETWNDQIAAAVESKTDADVAPLMKLDPKARSLRLRAFVDQTSGRMVVDAPSGARLADLKLGSPGPASGQNIALHVMGDEVRLEQIRVYKWEGTEPPPGADLTQAHLRREDGTVVLGKIQGYDPKTRSFLLPAEVKDRKKDEKDKPKSKDDKPSAKDQDTVMRIPVDSVNGIVLEGASKAPETPYRVHYLDGTQLGGEFVSADGKAITLRLPGFASPLALPIDGVRSIITTPPLAELKPDPNPIAGRNQAGVRRPTQPAEPTRTVTQVEMEGVRLIGTLEPVKGEAKGASCFAWKPADSETAAPILAGKGAKVTSTTVRNPGAQSSVTSPMAESMPGMMSGRAGNPANFVKPPNIYLRTGDIIPCEITRIDEEGITFKSPISPATFVPHAKVKAVELATENPNAVRLTTAKRDRLLTLPRMQKGSPPTQLIRSRNGDFARGRLVEMDGKSLKLEVRLETKELDRAEISRIIWLHSDELPPPKDDEKAADPKKDAPAAPAPVIALSPNRVHVIRKDRTRITFVASGVEDRSIKGQSDVLGACHVKLDDVDQLMIGSAIEKESKNLAYAQWKLRNAQEPVVVQDDGTGGDSAGTASSLVNQPAPDFNLDMLDGKKFKLSESKGTVVILDFWATWCGPCLQAMPQVEKVAEEFAGKGVKLVAVNLQEQPRQIKATLERHKMKVDVALDTTGAIAEKYKANAIPQTVIVGRDGKIARLFVGGGPKFGETLRAALEEVLKAK